MDAGTQKKLVNEANANGFVQMKTPSAVELAGIQKIIEDWSGLKIILTNGGPSISDPEGLNDGYIAFKGKWNCSMYLSFDDNGIIQISAGGKEIWHR